MTIDWIAIIATILGGYPIYKEVFQSLRHKRISMEVSMTFAIGAALAIRDFTVAVLIAFFVVFAEFIETYSTDKARGTIEMLEKASPRKALVERNGAEIEVDLQALALEDVVIVREGERIPVDGVVVKGSAFINQASITGEAAGVEKTIGNKVYAGSVNESGLISVRTEKVGNETVFGTIIKLVKEAEGRRARVQKIADRLAAWIIVFALGASTLTYFVTGDLTTTLSVLIVAGACGVAAGTPLAIVATIGRVARSGVIVKGGIYIEEMSRIDTAVVDKTGTLTFGEPAVSEILTLGECSQLQLLGYAAAAERYSNHPIARAVLEKAQESGVSFPEQVSSTSIPGKGILSVLENGERILVGNELLMEENRVDIPREISAVSSEGKTVVFIAYHERLCGAIVLSDRIRLESKKAITDLKRMGIKTIMLTGDSKQVAAPVGREVGVDEVYAELFPQDKVSMVEKLLEDGSKVAMIGDGVNDAPALARANVGIGMGAGTDVAIEEADVVLMTNDLHKISETVKASRKAYRTIMQNFYGTLIIDGVGIVLAFLGFLNPILAAAIHIGSELLFISNSARLIRW
nr:cation-translocating P-type ATPase [Candidatus Freyarchaeota archaeon]